MKFERDSKNLGVRVLKGTGLLVGARLIVRGFSLVNLVILARLLSPDDYGIAALAIAAIGTFAAFSDLKLAAALTATDDIGPAHLNTAFTLSLLRGLVIAATLFALAEPLARFLEVAALGPVMRALSLVFILDGLINPAFWMYQRNLDFSKEFGRATLAQAFSSILTIAAALFFRSYWAIVIGTIGVYAANMILSYWRIEFRPRLGLSRWREMVGFGGWLTLQGMAAQLTALAPRLLIPKLLSPAALGVYTIGRDTVSLPLDELLGPLRRTFFPSFSAIRHEPERLRRTVRLAMSTLLGVALPVGVGMAVLAEQLLLILVGGQWLEAAVILQWVAPPMAMMLSTSPVVGLAMATGELRSLFFRSAGLAVFAWAAIFGGLKLYGFDGAVAAVAASQIANLAVNLVMLRRLIGEPLYRWASDSWRSFVSAGLMALALTTIASPDDVDASHSSLATLFDIIPYVLIGAAIYAASHMLLWRLARRPDGFEANMLHYGRLVHSSLLQKLRSR